MPGPRARSRVRNVRPRTRRCPDRGSQSRLPRRGSYTIAFLTGVPGGDVVNHLKEEYVSVYVPTTPNP
ncbi:DUF502 domain-containing protein, partial [Burkholderia gladioli]|nr:DUF502 domain-containing protein [Burkholderia gladioli]